MRNKLLISLYLCCFLIKCFGETPNPLIQQYNSKLLPVFDKYCMDCHDDDLKKGGLDMTSISGDIKSYHQVKFWEKMIKLIKSGEMPPKKKKNRPSPQELLTIKKWVNQSIEVETKRLKTVKSKNFIRRMTNREFNRTLLDILDAGDSKYDFTKATSTPQDSKPKEGFSHFYGANKLTDFHLECYKRSALEAFKLFAPFKKEKARELQYVYQGEVCYTSRATQDFIIDYVKRAPHPINKVNYEHWKQITKLKGRSQLKRPMDTSEWGPGLLPFRPGQLKDEQNNLLLANSFAFPATQTFSKGTFTIRIRARAKTDEKGTLPKMRVRVGYLDRYVNKFLELDSVYLKKKAGVYTFSGYIRDYPYINTVSHKNTFRDGNIPKLNSFEGEMAKWAECSSSFLVFIIENASRHEKGLPIEKGLFRNSIGNVFVGSFAEARHRAHHKTLPSYELTPAKLVQTYFSNLKSMKGKVPLIEIDWIDLKLNEFPKINSMFFSSNNRGENDAYAKQVISRFLKKASRGLNLKSSDHQHYFKLYKNLKQSGLSFEKSIHETLATFLASPQFLYLGQYANEDIKAKQASYLLASRLSYWLWGTKPDELLLQKCKDNQLFDPKVLAHQVDRLLKDKRFNFFVEHFIEELWELKKDENVIVDTTRHPSYDQELESDIKEQFRKSIFEILAGDKPTSTLNLLKSNETWVNQRLAKHYNIKSYKGHGRFTRVKTAAGSPIGGVLTQARIMKMNSDGIDSHPIRRGIWLMEHILYTVPPPPPKITPLDDKVITGTTLRERIAEHAKQGSSCISCHAKIDPFGIAFENFDASGAWREKIVLKDKTIPVDAVTSLTDGTKFNDCHSLLNYMLNTKSDDFIDHFIKFATYNIIMLTYRYLCI